MPQSSSTASHSSRDLYLRLLTYVRPYWRAFVLAIILMAISSAMEPAVPALMKLLLDGSFGGKSPYGDMMIALLIVGVFVLRGGLGFCADYAMAWVSNKIVLDLRNGMFRRLVQLPTPFFDNQSSGITMSRIAYDVTGVTGAATSVLTASVKDTLSVVGLLAWMFYLDWMLSLVALLMVPCIALAVRGFSKRLRDTSRGVQKAMGGIMHVLEETVEAHKVVKIFGGQAYEAHRFLAANAEQRGQSMRQTVAAAALGPIVQTFAAIALAIIIFVALRQSAAGGGTLGSFASFITAMMMLLAPMKRLTDINAPFQRGLAAAESVFGLIDEQPEDDHGAHVLGRARGDVEFKGVRLCYPGSTREALAGVDLKLPAGQTVALVGASGSGKTSLANLLPRFYHPTAGDILIDGHSIEQLTLASLRANIALVSQDVVLFNDSVAANIAYGVNGKIAHDALIEAARAAHALEFIEAMPQGFDTMIGENGVKLSGGQRQRLAIARAILKNAPILILDEATSALDTESERHVQAALNELMKNRTTLVVAHRLSTIEHADRIVVLSQGRIVEQGRHGELIAMDGAYANFYRMQRSAEAAASQELNL